MPARLIRHAVLASILLSAQALSAQAQTRTPDESALRYYASHGQRTRAEAEGRRLAALHPGWTVPDEIWTARPGQADEKPLWALFAAEDLAGLKRAIAQRQRVEPDWQPSDDLAHKLRRKEIRRTIMAKLGGAQWLAITDIAEGFGKAGDDIDDVELAWAVAEALARTDRQPEALALYGAILNRRSDPKERRATIQKAIGLLAMTDVEQLLAMGRTQGDGAPEFAALALDVTRGRISALLRDEDKVAVAPAELATFENQARAAQAPDDAGLAAWFALKQNRTSDALGWFKLAISRGGDAMIAHGLAHTLLRLGQRREAEEVAFAWREPLVNNAILFIDVLEQDLTRPAPPAIEPERLARYARVTLDSRSGEGAQAMGWYAYNSCQFSTALDWFQRASAWLPKETTIYGQALSLQRLKRQRDYIELINRYDGLFPKVVGLLFRHYEDLPGPCDRQEARKLRPIDENGWIGTAAAMRIPQPGPALSPDAALAAVRRSGFPIAVQPGNPLRFPDSGTSQDAHRRREQEPRPLVARRVGGVIAMPYEALGFALLPGWNGSTSPSDIASSAQPPALGTLWSRPDAAQAESGGAIRPAGEPRLVINDPATSRFRR